MTSTKIPHTDSIAELAEFWDTHDLTEFEDQFEEVTEPVFERKTVMAISLSPQEMALVQEIAQIQGIDLGELIRSWVLEKIETAR